MWALLQCVNLENLGPDVPATHTQSHAPSMTDQPSLPCQPRVGIVTGRVSARILPVRKEGVVCSIEGHTYRCPLLCVTLHGTPPAATHSGFDVGSFASSPFSHFHWLPRGLYQTCFPRNNGSHNTLPSRGLLSGLKCNKVFDFIGPSRWVSQVNTSHWLQPPPGCTWTVHKSIGHINTLSCIWDRICMQGLAWVSIPGS